MIWSAVEGNKRPRFIYSFFKPRRILDDFKLETPGAFRFTARNFPKTPQFAAKSWTPMVHISCAGITPRLHSAEVGNTGETEKIFTANKNINMAPCWLFLLAVNLFSASPPERAATRQKACSASLLLLLNRHSLKIPQTPQRARDAGSRRNNF